MAVRKERKIWELQQKLSESAELIENITVVAPDGDVTALNEAWELVAKAMQSIDEYRVSRNTPQWMWGSHK